MAKKAKKLHTTKGLELKIVNPDAAGIDIADSELQVCVPSDRDGDNNRRFGSFTQDLRFICDWLKACNITTVAMEATGIYWLSLFLMLQKEGFDVVLVNARDVKNISEKKTDEADAEWLMLLHSYGLLKASFQPDEAARSIRNLCRHRNNIQKAASKSVQHMQKAMEQMNIKLTNVISDILGKSGQAIISAILQGNHDPKSLAQLADPRCKKSKEEIALSLEATWDEDHLFALKQSYDQYKFYQKQIEECDIKIEELMMAYSATMDTDMAKFVKTKKRINKKNSTRIDVEKYAYSLWGVNVMQIPGMSANSIMQLIGELGHDFVDKFDTAAKFCRWCNIVPNTKISGGKILSSKVPKRKNPVGQIFRMCANTLKDSKETLGFYFRRMKSKDGHMQAIVATAHKLAKIFYTMIKTKSDYDASKVGQDEKELLKRKIERTQKALEKLNAKLSDAA
ncbi:MAG: IS110 family transposase [Prevotellaceae bacterium]|nr:IS110 family transposase [Candidatus Minthosoma equi]